MSETKNVGIYIFENMTMLDGYAPLQVLSLVESFNCFTFAREASPIPCDSGVQLMPQYGLADCPPVDILVMPGGGDVLPPMTDASLMSFLGERADDFSHVTSVCTGALILAEAGLLDGYRATTHWAWREELARYYPNIDVVDERVAVDRNRITGGGITAGIDFALTLIAEAVDEIQAQAMQLLVEYRPAPPFNAGSPESAPPPVTAAVTAKADEVMAPLREYLAAKAA